MTQTSLSPSKEPGEFLQSRRNDLSHGSQAASSVPSQSARPAHHKTAPCRDKMRWEDEGGAVSATLSSSSVDDRLKKASAYLQDKDMPGVMNALESALARHAANEAHLRDYIATTVEELTTWNGRAGAPHPEALSVIRLARQFGQ